MALGTPTDIGGNYAFSSATVAITTTAVVPSGGLVIVTTGSTGSTAVTGVSDGTNAYSAAGAASSRGSNRYSFWAFYYPSGLASGSTITVTRAGASGNCSAAACYVTGALSTGFVDVSGTLTTGNSTTPSIVLTGMSQAAEAAFVFTWVTSGSSNTITEDTADGFVSLAFPNPGGGSSVQRWAYKILSAASAVTYDPVLSDSKVWDQNYITIREDTGGGPPPDPDPGAGSFKMMMGIGR